jgi:VanZ family protein
MIVGGATLLVVATALLVAFARIRNQSSGTRMGFLAVAASVVLGTSYAFFTSTGNADIDVVEHVHFIEYGLLALLFYRSWRGVEDASLLLSPLLAGVLVGTIDEWFQWFIPARVGEARDVLLNAVAIVCGLLLALGLDPPTQLGWAVGHRSARHMTTIASLSILVFAGFFYTVHLGYEIRDPEIGRFRSRYTADDLQAASRERDVRWARQPPLALRPLSQEDQYFSEGMWHVRRRNQSWSDGNTRAAWRENRILEKYYSPLLDTPSYLAPEGVRWPREQQADAERRAGGDDDSYVSRANPFPIYPWSRTAFVAEFVFVICVVGATIRRFSNSSKNGESSDVRSRGGLTWFH